MDINWIRIYKTPELYQAKVIEALLKDGGIACQLMNKQDSMLVFGFIEIYVPEELQKDAISIIDDNQDELMNWN